MAIGSPWEDSLEAAKMREYSAAQRRKDLFVEYGLWGVIIGLCIVFTILTRVFILPENIINILLQTSIIGTVAIGMTFVIISGGIDLSVSATIAMSAVATARLANTGSGWLLPMAVGIGVGGIAGLVNGVVVSKGKVPAFVVTLGTMSLYRGLALLSTGAQPVYDLNERFLSLGYHRILGLPVLILFFVGVFVVALLFQTQTRTARYVYAIGDNPVAAHSVGLPVASILLLVYCISGFLSGLGGVLLAARVGAGEPTVASGMELDVIAAVIIGGTSLFGGKGGVHRTILGILIIGIINNGLDLMSIPMYYQMVAKGIIIVGAVLVDRWRIS
jgi:ribose/xylose/arabinose/galactoside ABC-type transport system permease subunit